VGTVDGVDVSDHSARHELAGDDVLNVGGLSGVLADNQPPADHGTAAHSGTIGTPTQVGLGNVTNDAQLKRGDADWAGFDSKTTPISTDEFLIEDAAAGGAKKRVLVSNLPGGVDTTALHKATAAEISAMSEIDSASSLDVLVIEDASDSFNKKKLPVSKFPGGTDPNAIHDNVDAEISPLSDIGSPAAADVLIIEDASDSYSKKKVLASALTGGGGGDVSSPDVTTITADSVDFVDNYMQFTNPSIDPDVAFAVGQFILVAGSDLVANDGYRYITWLDDEYVVFARDENFTNDTGNTGVSVSTSAIVAGPAVYGNAAGTQLDASLYGNTGNFTCNSGALPVGSSQISHLKYNAFSILPPGFWQGAPVWAAPINTFTATTLRLNSIPGGSWNKWYGLGSKFEISNSSGGLNDGRFAIESYSSSTVTIVNRIMTSDNCAFSGDTMTFTNPSISLTGYVAGDTINVTGADEAGNNRKCVITVRGSTYITCAGETFVTDPTDDGVTINTAFPNPRETSTTLTITGVDSTIAKVPEDGLYAFGYNVACYFSSPPSGDQLHAFEVYKDGSAVSTSLATLWENAGQVFASMGVGYSLINMSKDSQYSVGQRYVSGTPGGGGLFWLGSFFALTRLHDTFL
ncbi:MAG: hypothetical protein JRD89_19415, partial [Deltaproteobacteria bacterium]|nr:hypothetical protein [Deltaproteobacteria bacterium]